MTRFADKTVIVTGAGSGMGAATARKFAAEGANVVLAGRRAEPLEAVARDLPEGRALAVTADVTQPGDAARLVAATLERFGALDVLVNNAGTARTGRIDALPEEDWDMVIETDLTGVYRMTRAAWEALAASGGNVVNTSSVSGLGGDWGMFAYNAAKGGVSNLTRALALDYASSGIRVNAVAPGYTRTPMAEGIGEDDALRAKFEERIPMGRGAEPEEVADAIAFLASAEAGFVNGVNLPVDGGLSASNGQPPQA
ncbi:SDR family NAD(P)-dependent oxidoreductase [Mangrovicoccus algicola]|uniref:SDR family oxidoreductase n=1 Tax=Mangrovicoccus algicola TaxID=2771008 RepID=A0A8J7CZ29_9RHOB|nr:SDR family oxidoreductase [Mangrovicoccus algicola]MBE3640332.1 SDR family oxidoreductase [Mangrovicoccus algicola]